MAIRLSLEQQASLRNPFYQALTTRQREFKQVIGNVMRYHPEVLPLGAVVHQETTVDAAFLCRNTDIIFAGVLPKLKTEVAGSEIFPCLQMTWQPRSRFAVPDALPEEVVLGPNDADEMLELTSVTLPGYFRPQSYRLGHFVGLRINGQLVAMAGHRARTTGMREISNVCTRPGFTGRGYARHLIGRLLIDTPDALPFLHTLPGNARTISIYEALGFVTTGEIEVLHIPQQTASTKAD